MKISAAQRQLLLKCIEKGENEQAKVHLTNVEVGDLDGSFVVADNSRSSTTLLHHSARCGNAAMVRHLLERGCKAKAVDSSGFTPLMLAVRHADPATVEVMVNDAGFVFHQKTLRLALDRAVKSSLSPEREKAKCRAILETLLDNATESDLPDDLERFAAVVFGKTELARLLLGGDYLIDFREPARGYTALHCAFAYGKVESVRALKRHGADDRLVDYMGFSPFHFYPGNLELVDAKSSLLQNFLILRADLYVPDRRGLTEVEYLLRCGNEETRKTVLTIGFAMIVAAYVPDSAVHRLEEEIVRKMMELLLQNGFDAQRFDGPGVPFIQTLREHDHKSVLRVFIAHLALIGRLSDSTREAIASEPSFKEQFDASTEVVEMMKARVIHGRVSLFKILTDDERKLAAYVRNEKSSREVLDTALSELPASEEYYRGFLRKRIEDAFRRAKFEEKIVATVQMLTGLDADLYHVIIYMIIGYLDQCDLNNLCRVGGM